ncbi:MAG: EF2563 family selenium-dependent molybdenum hydroxylase system protein [Lachnospiraceae bacterium]|jgi:xanthine dehydrogenase accessory factor|nr:EF2563 family selenium-dependent molybdenum hydroxylase system protein [Lachnospiraceae bacterium]
MIKDKIIVVRGGGDLATGTIHRLWSSRFKVLVLETHNPAAIRRQVSLCEAVYTGKTTVEGMTGVLVGTFDNNNSSVIFNNKSNDIKANDCLCENKYSQIMNILNKVWDKNYVPILIDPKGECIKILHPFAVIDGILAKKNLGTTKDMADITIGLGPGFKAGYDVDVVIETKRGHNLGRVIRNGLAKPNTGIPGVIGGIGKERVIHSVAEGIFQGVKTIGDIVTKDEEIGYIVTKEEQVPVFASISGIIRGLIRDGFKVTKGFKIADIDPRISELENCFTISDKARCIAGSVLEVIVGQIQNIDVD